MATDYGTPIQIYTLMGEQAMRPVFWKLLHRSPDFNDHEFATAITDRVVSIYEEPDAKGKQTAKEFLAAKIGDYFLLVRGSEGIHLLGQFMGGMTVSTV